MTDETLPTPNIYDSQVPNFQIAWDSTSLGWFKTCPRLYYYNMIEHWTPKRMALPLKFGILFHKSFEVYEDHKASGLDHNGALLETVKWALDITWDRETNQPWTPDDPRRGRISLVRSIVWYWDFFQDDPAETVILHDGKPATELSFRMEFPYNTPSGDPILMCGHIDRLVNFADQIWVMDHKTTVRSLSSQWFDGYTPDNQMSLYSLASQVVFDTETAGTIVNGIQLAQEFIRIQRGFAPRPKPVLEEWIEASRWWLDQAQRCAEREHWPMNDKACHLYGGCQYRHICSQSPSVRKSDLKADFTQESKWNPLIPRD